MASDNDPISEPTLFSAVLTPHRSLGRTGFCIVMLGVSAISFAGGVVFFLVDAWPVVGFLGLDVALVYWAFRANYRAAAAYEEVVITPSELRLRKVSYRGDVAEWSLNPLWAQLEHETHDEFGIAKLFLAERGRRIAVANFLGPTEKERLADALLAALAAARRGPTRTVVP
ncbi:MAG: DUF2244 domain-containing protein [Rhizobiales bacterium]|nr:DUF2244 domain-containing protein [Hyphomicrobiales bacterium]